MRRRLRLSCFYGRTLSRTVPAVCTGPPCQEMAQIHSATKIPASAWNSTDFCQITQIPNSSYEHSSLSRKNVYDHCCCPISANKLTTSQLEAILKIYRSSLKLSKWGRAGGGGKVKRGERGWQETTWRLLSGDKEKRGGGGGKEKSEIIKSNKNKK